MQLWQKKLIVFSAARLNHGLATSLSLIQFGKPFWQSISMPVVLSQNPLFEKPCLYTTIGMVSCIAPDAVATVPTWDMRDWLGAWPALALACGLPLDAHGAPRIPSVSQQWKRGHRAGAPVTEALFFLTVRTAIRRRLIGARDLIIDSAPVLAWRRSDPDAAVGHAPAQHPRPLLRGYRVHTLLCRGSGLPIFFLLSRANVHDAPFARPLLEWAVHLYHIHPRVIRLDAAYWGLRLIGWIHATLGAVAVVPWNPKRQKNRSCLPPTWTKAELGKRSSIERFFGRVLLFFHLQRPPLCGWSAIARQVALTYTASVIVALAAQQAGRPDLIRSPKRVLAHSWEGLTMS